MKQIDIITVTISSATLILFCLCSFWLLSEYAELQRQLSVQSEREISQLQQSVDQLQRGEGIDRQRISDQLQASQQIITAKHDQWQILEQVLSSMITILVVIVISHLSFVYTLFRRRRKKPE